MDPQDFDRMIARARDPRLIPGIYNYCDGRCPRCAFTERCLVFLENVGDSAEHRAEDATADDVEVSLERTIAMLSEIARREGVDLSALACEPDPDRARVMLEHERDPLVAHARDYSTIAWRVSRALAPVITARGDQPVIDAVQTIEWFSSRIAAKLYRAVCGVADAWQADDDVQTDYDGSAKAALIAIRESRAAWATLMEAGKATADGVPARAANALDELEAAVRVRFPRAEQFVRPGFDEPAVAAGAPATLPPWARRPVRSGGGER
ncbi:MAG TPA: hypothetical protein VKE51_11880 [Vicinamibacterales bacterium]|nr:hypothetical protein [Vicinamibacterales bacterium]